MLFLSIILLATARKFMHKKGHNVFHVTKNNPILYPFRINNAREVQLYIIANDTIYYDIRDEYGLRYHSGIGRIQKQWIRNDWGHYTIKICTDTNKTIKVVDESYYIRNPAIFYWSVRDYLQKKGEDVFYIDENKTASFPFHIDWYSTVQMYIQANDTVTYTIYDEHGIKH